jgi:hypothetical protein
MVEGSWSPLFCCHSEGAKRLRNLFYGGKKTGFFTLRNRDSESYLDPVIARLTKSTEAILWMGRGLPRSARNDIRGKVDNDMEVT